MTNQIRRRHAVTDSPRPSQVCIPSPRYNKIRPRMPVIVDDKESFCARFLWFMILYIIAYPLQYVFEKVSEHRRKATVSRVHSVEGNQVDSSSHLYRNNAVNRVSVKFYICG